ncbi:hypothetical protein BS47DRAFT_1402866 [Hydnum rufescens UP504]|uniref:HECT-type E3 ubiquitin transferase n=1 Tax=Hydnum rufescens UP504 TaxID=1448309 RepID=A0A9P6DLY6_9AGAM|nr:hypothetical protein BS47DRAFT_1402866 [Hydnum rufescens UP504]
MNAYPVVSLHKMILKKEITLSDLESINTDLSHGTTWILKNNPTDLVFKAFTTPHLGGTITIELKPMGADITVTEENKKEFVVTVTGYRILCCLARAFDEHELKLLPIGDMSATDASKPSKVMPGPSESESVSNLFTTKPKKCCRPIVYIKRIKNRSRASPRNVVHLSRVRLVLGLCGQARMTTKILDQMQGSNGSKDGRGHLPPRRKRMSTHREVVIHGKNKIAAQHNDLRRNTTSGSLPELTNRSSKVLAQPLNRIGYPVVEFAVNLRPDFGVGDHSSSAMIKNRKYYGNQTQDVNQMDLPGYKVTPWDTSQRVSSSCSSTTLQSLQMNDPIMSPCNTTGSVRTSTVHRMVDPPGAAKLDPTGRSMQGSPYRDGYDSAPWVTLIACLRTRFPPTHQRNRSGRQTPDIDKIEPSWQCKGTRGRSSQRGLAEVLASPQVGAQSSIATVEEDKTRRDSTPDPLSGSVPRLDTKQLSNGPTTVKLRICMGFQKIHYSATPEDANVEKDSTYEALRSTMSIPSLKAKWYLGMMIVVITRPTAG